MHEVPAFCATHPTPSRDFQTVDPFFGLVLNPFRVTVDGGYRAVPLGPNFSFPTYQIPSGNSPTFGLGMLGELRPSFSRPLCRG